MGFIGIDEGSKQGAGTVMLDLLLKGGTMSEEDGKWIAADDAAHHRNYVFGDRKSIEMLQAFKNDLQGRGVSLSDMSSQCDEFEKALETLMSLPQDWHTGVNMIVSIF